MLENIHDLEIARLHNERDPLTGQRRFHLKNLATLTGMSIPWVSKKAKQADPAVLIGALENEIRRFACVASDTCLPPSARMKARVRSVLLTKLLYRLVSRFAARAAA